MTEISEAFKAEFKKYKKGGGQASFVLLKLAGLAKLGVSEEKYLCGRLYLDYGDIRNAFNFMAEAAIAGHRKAKFYALEFPEEIYNFEMELLTNARDGFPRAQYIVGNYYSEGKNGYGENQKEAMICWQRAAKESMVMAKEGVSPAQILLAEMYLAGKGVPQSLIHAYAWTEIAAINGQPRSSEIHDHIMKKGITNEEIIRAEMKVADMLEANPELYEDLSNSLD